MLMPAPNKLMHSQYVKQYMKTRENQDDPSSIPTKVLGRVRNLIAMDSSGERFPVCLRVSEKKQDDGKVSFTAQIQAVDEEIDGWSTVDTSGIIQVQEYFIFHLFTFFFFS